MKAIGILRLSILSLSIMVFYTHLVSSNDYEVITDPIPTHVEKNFKNLQVVKEITQDLDSEYFLAVPSSLTAAGDGSIFVFDKKLQKIFKFSKDFKFLKTFGSVGIGPGEYNGSPHANKQLYFSGDQHLYISDAHNRKFITFDINGNYIKEISIPYPLPLLVPVVKEDGRYLLPSKFANLDEFDKKGESVISIPKSKLANRFLFRRSAAPMVSYTYDYLPDGRIIVYNPDSSTVHIYKNGREEKVMDVWPKQAIEKGKEIVEKFKKRNSHDNWTTYLFSHFFVDKDDNNGCFYLYTQSVYRYKSTVYKFNLDGQLTEVLNLDRKEIGSLSILTKRHDLFYGISRDGSILILKEEIKNES